jgi:hypothetical protein
LLFGFTEYEFNVCKKIPNIESSNIRSTLFLTKKNEYITGIPQGFEIELIRDPLACLVGLASPLCKKLTPHDFNIENEVFAKLCYPSFSKQIRIL